MDCSDLKEKPVAWQQSINFKVGHDAPTCWCGDICKMKQSSDWDERRGRRFWMCPNYAWEKPKPTKDKSKPTKRKPKQTNIVERPRSPPPICQYYRWIDFEQDRLYRWEVQNMTDKAWERFWEKDREEERAKKEKEQAKIDALKAKNEMMLREMERSEKTEKARVAREAWEAERAKEGPLEEGMYNEAWAAFEAQLGREGSHVQGEGARRSREEAQRERARRERAEAQREGARRAQEMLDARRREREAQEEVERMRREMARRAREEAGGQGEGASHAREEAGGQGEGASHAREEAYARRRERDQRAREEERAEPDPARRKGKYPRVTQ